jgi:hypothetical protein
VTLEEVGRVVVEHLTDPRDDHEQCLEGLGRQRVDGERRCVALDRTRAATATPGRRPRVGAAVRGRRLRRRGLSRRGLRRRRIEGAAAGEVRHARLERRVHPLHLARVAAGPIGVHVEREPATGSTHVVERRLAAQPQDGEGIVAHVPG